MDLAEDAKRQSADIIVFPEDGLTGFLNCRRDDMYPYLQLLPTDPVGAVACNNTAFDGAPIVVAASCLARRLGLVLVLDVGTVVPCTGATDPACPPDGRYQYNTQLAFDSDGALLARFYKYHLFYEPQYDRPAVPQTVTFEALGGVTFGMMVCFGIMFDDPSSDLVATGATDVVFSSWWVNTPPSVWSTEWYQAWSRHYGLTLLAAGAVMDPAFTFSGSGVFQRGAALTSFFNTQTVPRSQLLVVTVPGTAPPAARPPAPRARWLGRSSVAQPAHCSTKTAPWLATATAATGPPHAHAPAGQWGWDVAAVSPTPASYSVVSSSGLLTCAASFTTATAAPNAVYGVLAFTGTFDNAYNESSCFFVACTSSADCATTKLDATATFAKVTLHATYGGDGALVTPFPLAGLSHGDPVPADVLDFSVTATSATVVVAGVKEGLLSVGLLGPKLHHL